MISHDLIGETVINIIRGLPNHKWLFRESCHYEWKPAKLHTLTFVYYETKKPRNEVDLYKQVDISKGITLEDIAFANEISNDTLIGLTSLTQIQYLDDEYFLPLAHIPMIDFDTDENFNHLNDNELLNIIKSKIRDETEVSRGLILKSGPKRNFHFIGIGYLLSENDYFTFLGLALQMRHKNPDGKVLNLVDARHIGHGLSPMKYLADLHNEEAQEQTWSRYDFSSRFMTLRLTPKPQYHEFGFPKVVDILD